MSGVKGNPATLKELRKKLLELPRTVAIRTAAEGASVINDLARSQYTSGQTVYSTSRPVGAKGDKLDLVESGATLNTMHFASAGTTIWCVLGPRWAKYLVGKYAILPRKQLPAAWSEALAAVLRDVGGAL